LYPQTAESQNANSTIDNTVTILQDMTLVGRGVCVFWQVI